MNACRRIQFERIVLEQQQPHRRRKGHEREMMMNAIKKSLFPIRRSADSTAVLYIRDAYPWRWQLRCAVVTVSPHLRIHCAHTPRVTLTPVCVAASTPQVYCILAHPIYPEPLSLYLRLAPLFLRTYQVLLHTRCTPYRSPRGCEEEV